MGVLLLKRIRLVCVGKASKPFVRDGIAEYLKRIKGFYEFSVVEIAEKLTVQKECDAVLEHLRGSANVLLDVEGETVSSPEFAEIIRAAHDTSDEITFVIGGASGVDARVKARCKRVSFGRVTYPHQIARLLLTEQIYRAATILNRLPYHK